MGQTKTIDDINAYKNINSNFNDFESFEGDSERRQQERDAFINNLEYEPNYDYPKLDFLIDNDDILARKRSICEAVIELETAKDRPDCDAAEMDLYAGYHEERLKKIMLVEAARNLRNSISDIDMEINRQNFAELNAAIYGVFDEVIFLGMMASEKNKLSLFAPKSDAALGVKVKLGSLINGIDTKNNIEPDLMDMISMRKLHDFVINRYRDILSQIPNTDDSVYYDVNDCVKIINQTLKIGGLSDFGWLAEESAEKSNPTTNQDKKIIYLPSNTRRTAAELRRLVVHEQEVHARRAQNASSYGIKPIQMGTADYADIEEGLAVLMECAIDGCFDNPSFYRVRNRYITAGLALGIDGTPRDARETYEILWRLICMDQNPNGEITEEDVMKSKNLAYSHIENAYRGTQFWMKGVIYTKLKVYYEGLQKNSEFFKRNIDKLESVFAEVFAGKYDHTDETEKTLVLNLINSSKNNNATD